jgi:hypothetical protein
MTKEQDDRFIAALERGMPKADAIKAIYEQYPMTVHLGILTGSRPIGARLKFVNIDGRAYEGRIVNLTESDLGTIFYRLHLDVGTPHKPDVLIFDLPISHEVTLLTGREGRPEDGHTFRITVVSRGSGGIMREGDEKPHDYQDSAEFGDLVLTADVRAWSQAEALRRASEMELRDWRLPSGVSLWHAREGDL